MAKLFGAQRLVLQAIQVLTEDAAGFVADAQVAQGTNIALKDVRDWIETLEGEGHVEVARTEVGLAPQSRRRAASNCTCTSRSPRRTAPSPGQVHLSRYNLSRPRRQPPEPVSSSAIRPSSLPVLLPSSEPDATSSTAGDMDGFQVVLLIHGIRTQAEWRAMVRTKIAVPGQIEVIPIKYGYFDALRFWFPFWTRNRPIERVYTQIRVALQKYRRKHPEPSCRSSPTASGRTSSARSSGEDFDLTSTG